MRIVNYASTKRELNSLLGLTNHNIIFLGHDEDNQQQIEKCTIAFRHDMGIAEFDSKYDSGVFPEANYTIVKLNDNITVGNPRIAPLNLKYGMVLNVQQVSALWDELLNELKHNYPLLLQAGLLEEQRKQTKLQQSILTSLRAMREGL